MKFIWNILRLLKYSYLERVAFQLYTLQCKGCPSGTCRVPQLHPTGGKLPRRECVVSPTHLDALECIANFESDPLPPQSCHLNSYIHLNRPYSIYSYSRCRLEAVTLLLTLAALCGSDIITGGFFPIWPDLGCYKWIYIIVRCY
jgi:hypothetical protein